MRILKKQCPKIKFLGLIIFARSCPRSSKNYRFAKQIASVLLNYSLKEFIVLGK